MSHTKSVSLLVKIGVSGWGAFITVLVAGVLLSGFAAREVDPVIYARDITVHLWREGGHRGAPTAAEQRCAATARLITPQSALPIFETQAYSTILDRQRNTDIAVSSFAFFKGYNLTIRTSSLFDDGFHDRLRRLIAQLNEARADVVVILNDKIAASLERQSILASSMAMAVTADGKLEPKLSTYLSGRAECLKLEERLLRARLANLTEPFPQPKLLPNLMSGTRVKTFIACSIFSLICATLAGLLFGFIRNCRANHEGL